MDQIRIKNIYISNLDFISYQSNELIRGECSNIHYSDFYFFYTDYVKHLKGIYWNNKSIDLLIKKFPIILKPRLSFQLLLMALIPLLAALISPFNIFEYLTASILLLIALLVTILWIGKRNKLRLNEIANICALLKKEIELQ